MSGRRAKIARALLREQHGFEYLRTHPDGWAWAVSQVLGVTEKWARQHDDAEKRRAWTIRQVQARADKIARAMANTRAVEELT